MKNIFVTIMLVLSSASLSLAQNLNKHDQVKIKKTVNDFFDGLALLNLNTVKQSASKDFLLLEDGAIWTMDTLATKINRLKSSSFSRTNHLQFIRISVDGNAAWVAYDNIANMVIDGQNINKHWLESAVLVKEAKEWKIKLLHSTPVKG